MKSPRTAREIANVVGVSDGTIRTGTETLKVLVVDQLTTYSAYKFLYEKKDALVEADWLKDKDGNVRGDIDELPKP